MGEGEKTWLVDHQAAALLDLSQDCANAPPNYILPEEPSDHHYLHAVDQLKAAVKVVLKRTWELRKIWVTCEKISSFRSLSSEQKEEQICMILATDFQTFLRAWSSFVYWVVASGSSECSKN